MKNKTTRFTKVNEGCDNVPFITIKAKWLQECGFMSHSKIEIEVHKEKLILKVKRESNKV